MLMIWQKVWNTLLVIMITVLVMNGKLCIERI